MCLSMATRTLGNEPVVPTSIYRTRTVTVPAVRPFANNFSQAARADGSEGRDRIRCIGNVRFACPTLIAQLPTICQVGRIQVCLALIMSLARDRPRAESTSIGGES